MTYVYITLAITIIALALSMFLKIDFVIAMPATNLTVIIFLYVLGFAGILRLGPTFMLIISVVGAFYILQQIILGNIGIRKVLFKPGFIIFVIFVAMNYLYNHDRLLAHWDEFSHWGLVVKNMYIFDTFGNVPESTTVFRDYPPGISLFLYLFISLEDYFKEPLLYLAFNFFQASLIIPVLAEYESLNWKKYVIPAFLIFSMPTIYFQTNYYSIYVDSLLGLLFAYILFSYYCSSEINNFTVYNLSIASAVLVLTKPIGILFAVLAILIIIIDYFFLRESQKKHKRYLIMLPLFAILISYLSWKFYLSMHLVMSSWDFSRLQLSTVVALFREVSEYRLTTIEVFFSRLKTFFYVIGLFIAISMLGYIPGSESLLIAKRRLFALSIYTCIGYLLYILVLLLLYLFIFSEYEAQRVASFSRYMNSYVLGLTMIWIYLFLRAGRNSFKYRNLILGGICILCSVSVVSAACYSKIINAYDIRAELDGTKTYANFMDGGNDRIYFISQGDNGFHRWIFHLNVTPIKTDGAWSLGSLNYYNEDIYTKDISIDEFRDILKEKYTFLYIFNADNYFINNYGELFGERDQVTDKTLYEIIKSDDGILLREYSKY